MKLALLSAALCAAVSLSTTAAFAQAGTEDTGASALAKYPLAPAAGVDSHSREKSVKGAVNQGAFNEKTFKFGPRGDAPAGGSVIWNPVMVKMKAGEKVTSATDFFSEDPKVYCAMANSGVDFIWTEHQHSPRDWNATAAMWAACPRAKAVPGVRVAYTDEREEQHALDAGALVLVVPTVRSIEEGTKARDWAMWPPLGHRSSGGGQGSSPAFWGQVPGGYRNTFNDNLVLILMIETLEGLRDSDKIAKLKGVTAIFAASGDLGNHTGYGQGDPDYERAINIVHDSALRAHVRLCGPYAWVDRPDFTCFQGPGGEGNVPAGGVTPEYAATLEAQGKTALGALFNTQGKPVAGPFTPGWSPPAPAGRGGRGGRGPAPAQ
jgi:2-keto-3-deoxy-L-rhamnonate aldolase RhmA